ncbi:aspartate--tRNA ligase [Mesotoga prima]|uniref:aspartate--tRNA ligase n=1 Tax=Mesotoga prima TaxID=1184387 RepID=UPI003D80F98C
MVILSLWEVLELKKRTHTCGELRASDTGKVVTLNGWVDRIRDLGGIKFVQVRDRYGFTQVVFDPQDNELYNMALKLGNEFCISVTGSVRKRPDDAINLRLPTGEIEIVASEMGILSDAEVPPIYINIDEESAEEMHLRYRYLDLRRPKMQRNILTRHRFVQAVREYLNNNGFVDVETPILGKSTPEGARDFLVPSRLKAGKFYALPQSPQIFKQLLMVSGFDRYYQIAKCFRDEDFRADRQPEFTQIDLEMSFADEEDVFSMTEGLMKYAFEKAASADISTPFRRFTYQEVVEFYGSDKPDTRYGMKIHDITSIFEKTAFKVISDSIDKGEKVKGFIVEGKADRFSRKKLDEYTAFAKENGLGGLMWLKVEGDGLKSSILKHCPEELSSLVSLFAANENDLILFSLGEGLSLSKALGQIRNKIIKEEEFSVEGFEFLWVTDFPMFSYNEEEQRIEAEHHPFTMPDLEDLEKYGESDPLKVRSKAYDLVLNGYEIASGSVRIHRRDIQSRVFDLIGLSREEATEKFGYLLEAFKYGPPPHAGIAPGLDRIIAIIVGAQSIREVIAFPKVASGADLMTSAPSEVSQKQLDLLKLQLKDTEN